MGKRREREEACTICGHYHDYLGGEPCSVCGHCLAPTNGAKPALPSSMPTEVIPGFLFLGSYDHASRSELLTALGITHILNTVPTCQNLYKNSFHYYTVSSTPPPLDECFQVLDRIRLEDKKVLVHCMSGISRSPAVVIYYIMRYQGWRLSKAFAWVQDRRPAVNLKAEDADRLQQAEAQLFLGGANSAQPALEHSLHLQCQSPAVQPVQQPGHSPLVWSASSADMSTAAIASGMQEQQQQQQLIAINVTAGQHGQQQAATSQPNSSRAGFPLNLDQTH